ncbi:MAG TPA: hypothetical protein VHD87_12845 [Acidimicrobiales bacterium]|nr:hypothetical protein [Acidimicrobiales bacterium]
MEQRCARCGGTYQSDFYGICPDCRSTLNDMYYKEPVERAAAGPRAVKMNVTPNAVAMPVERDSDDDLGG